MTVKAKRFRIGVEGATTDGREIQREWLVQMAASYNPTVYTALINLEHIKSYLPESTFNRYGRVTGLVAEEIQDGPLAGKMALYADIEPTDALVELVKKGQKAFHLHGGQHEVCRHRQSLPCGAGCDGRSCEPWHRNAGFQRQRRT